MMYMDQSELFLSMLTSDYGEGCDVGGGGNGEAEQNERPAGMRVAFVMNELTRQQNITMTIQSRGVALGEDAIVRYSVIVIMAMMVQCDEEMEWCYCTSEEKAGEEKIDADWMTFSEWSLVS